MSGPSFNNIGPFEADLSGEERWRRVGLLDKAATRTPEAWPALRILRWGCQTEKRRTEALMILNGLPTLSLRKLLWRYGELANKKTGEAA